eukprot:XP_011680496.1 PREDICTED: WSC domain-containing protein 2 [Strongylocentrotus purpuratus]
MGGKTAESPEESGTSPFGLPRFPRLRRHPVTIVRTALLIVFIALPAYVFLVLNAPGNGIDVDGGNIQYVVARDSIMPERPVEAPMHLHVRDADLEAGVIQGLRREALQVEQGRDQSSALVTVKKEEKIAPRKWRINFLYAGLQFYSECYCGSNLESEKMNNDSLCNLECSGNKSQICGGAPYLSVYRLKNDPGRAPNVVSQPRPAGQEEGPMKGFRDGYRSCAERPDDYTSFTKFMEESDKMTTSICITICEKQSLPLAALFRGSQCHCGYLTHNYTLRHTVEPSECQEPCAGDSSVFCGGTNYYAIYQTGVEDSRCTNIVMGKERTFPLITLASFPGSGNTWVRYLVERATGIFTGSYYDDGDLYRKGFLGERENWRKGNTIAVKTHRFDEEHISSFDGAILIIRNPYKAIMSEHNRKFGGHTGFANEKHYTQGTEWIDFVAGKSRTWTNTALNILQYSKKILVIHYEDLRNDPFESLNKMVQFLGQPPNEERILCTLSSPDGKFKRRESTRQKLSFDPYTDEMREVLSLYIKSVEMALKLKNQSALPKDYNPHLKL